MNDTENEEGSRRAAIRDLLAGAALLLVGRVTGGSALDADADRIDVLFDLLGALWMAWGAFRLVRGTLRRPRDADTRPQ